jgi:cbb3-type cytochrome oxidase maturation protein
MDILLLLIPLSLALVAAIGIVFAWSVKSGQYDDLDGPAHRVLADDDGAPPATDGAGASMTAVKSRGGAST